MQLPLSDIHTLSLQKSSPIHLHQQLYEGLREAILTGRFTSGLRLPSTRKLATELGVSRNTVINAFEQLQAEGFIETQTGAGSYIATLAPAPLLNYPHEMPSTTATAGKLSTYAKRLNANQARHTGQYHLAFTPGIPELKQFPLKIWSRLLSHHCRDASSDLLSYAPTAGYWPLREAVAEYLQACRAVQCSAEQVLITCGAQQALDLCARLLLDTDDTVWFEEPGYLGARGALSATGAKLIPIPVGDDGITIEPTVSSQSNPRLIYVTPSHQYPTGVTMSLQRRLELLSFARQNQAWVIEDDYDSEFRYRGRPLASLQGLAKGGNVIYIGTFSKVLMPALRLGYIVLPEPLVPTFEKARSFIDTHPPTATQVALNHFIREGHFAAHIRRMRRLYEHRQSVLLEQIDKQLSDFLTSTPNDAGMHLLASATEAFDDQKMAQVAARTGLQLRALSSYFIDKTDQSGFVLGYAGFDDDEISAGVSQLKKLFEILN